MRIKNTAAMIALLSLSITAAAQSPSTPTLTPIRVGQTIQAALAEEDFRYPNGALREDYEVNATPGGQIDVVFASTPIFPDLAGGVDSDGGCRDGCKTAPLTSMRQFAVFKCRPADKSASGCRRLSRKPKALTP